MGGAQTPALHATGLLVFHMYRRERPSTLDSQIKSAEALQTLSTAYVAYHIEHIL